MPASPSAMRATTDKMTGTLLAMAARLLSGATARWIDCQPDTCQRVYFANHTSHLDPIVIWSSLPGELRRWSGRWRPRTIGRRAGSAPIWPARSTPC